MRCAADAEHSGCDLQVQRDKKTKKPLMEDGKPRILTSHTLNPVCSLLPFMESLLFSQQLVRSAASVTASHASRFYPVLSWHPCAAHWALLPHMLFMIAGLSWIARHDNHGSWTCMQVPVAIGGPGLPEAVKFRSDLKEPGLANVAPTIINLLGFEAPRNMVPSLLA